ncbi:hypothetical protein [Cellulomonas sp. Root137]|uniref:hypothetical protein n=1 Tax=Cellulomonas sp. Root137 TaxID=1736459 RepID=UPI0007132219|nr:hypothetical protein [Cellulomonas sp. Root137]KQY44347.1 hypothetical protein ASD18_12450 [Cellulomonas sp. Root137]
MAADKTCSDVDLAVYRRRFDELKSPSPVIGFGLPWPRYPSHVWRYVYSPEYQNTPSRDLVSTLLPTRWAETRTLQLPGSSPWSVDVEAIRHPFALTTMAHAGPFPGAAWPSDPAKAAAQLRAILRTSVGAGSLVDGVPALEIPFLPDTSFEGLPLTLVPGGQFVVLSGIHDEKDGRAIASALARLFDDEADPTKAVALRSPRGAISVRGENVALTIPVGLPRTDQKLRCLHHNATTVLAQMQNLSTVLSGPRTTTCEWFGKQAASVLSHLHRRAPLTESGTIYKSRLPELWIAQRQLAPAINALTVDLQALPS